MSAKLYAHPAITHHKFIAWPAIAGLIRRKYGYIVTPMAGKLYLIPEVKPRTPPEAA